MRICIVTRSAPVHGIGGMQDHTRDLAVGCTRAGHDVTVITARHPRYLEEELVDNVRWRFVAASPRDFADRDWRFRSLEGFERAHAEEPFDVVHGEGSSALELVRAGVYRSVPVVIMFHGNFVGLVKASLRRQREARRPVAILREERGLVHLARQHFAKGNWYAFRSCEAIVASHQQFRDTCRSHLLDPKRVHVVPHGVDADVFRPRDRDALRRKLRLPDGILFVCAGRLVREKGAHHALRAVHDLRQTAPQARLLVVGDGEERSRLEMLAAELKVSDRVLFVGAQPPERMHLFLAAADVMVLPTERDEAGPIVLLQAMACGLPTVAFATGSVAEVIDRPNHNGLLVPTGDVLALTTGMHALYRDEGLRASIGGAARSRVEDQYTVERMVSQTVEVYEVASARMRAPERDFHS
jgi:glycosyltransferase involved in cell wall biosynthesis